MWNIGCRTANKAVSFTIKELNACHCCSEQQLIEGHICRYGTVGCINEMWIRELGWWCWRLLWWSRVVIISQGSCSLIVTSHSLLSYSVLSILFVATFAISLKLQLVYFSFSRVICIQCRYKFTVHFYLLAVVIISGALLFAYFVLFLPVWKWTNLFTVVLKYLPCSTLRDTIYAVISL